MFLNCSHQISFDDRFIRHLRLRFQHIFLIVHGFWAPKTEQLGQSTHHSDLNLSDDEQRIFFTIIING